MGKVVLEVGGLQGKKERKKEPSRSQGRVAPGPAAGAAMAVPVKRDLGLRPANSPPPYDCKAGKSYQGRKTHKHKQMCGIVPGLDGWQDFGFVFFLMGRNAHKPNPPQNPGTIPVKNLLMCSFLCVCVVFKLGSCRRAKGRCPPIKEHNF